MIRIFVFALMLMIALQFFVLPINIDDNTKELMLTVAKKLANLLIQAAALSIFFIAIYLLYIALPS